MNVETGNDEGSINVADAEAKRFRANLAKTAASSANNPTGMVLNSSRSGPMVSHSVMCST